MSTYAPGSKERQYERPTSRHPFYDVQNDLAQHVLLANEPEHVHKNFRTPLSYTRRRLARISSWPANWDSEGSAKPNIHSILRARRWIGHMRADATRTGKGWEEPHVAPDENGDIAFEWWKEDRNLIVYVSPDTLYYLQSWGPDIETQMVDGQIEDSIDNQKLWHWLQG